MKIYKQAGYIREMVAHRVDILAEFYDRAESAMAERVKRSRKRYPIPPGCNKSSPVSMQLSCEDADRILEEAGLVNPLFKEDEKMSKRVNEWMCI